MPKLKNNKIGYLGWRGREGRGMCMSVCSTKATSRLRRQLALRQLEMNYDGASLLVGQLLNVFLKISVVLCCYMCNDCVHEHDIRF